MPGYSGTPLIRKLGIKQGFRMRVLGAPEEYWGWLGPLPEEVVVRPRTVAGLDFVHLFTRRRRELEAKLPGLKEAVFPDGMIWVSWPKRASGVPTDVTEDVIRSTALPLGLVDVKVCAVSEIWSGLKLVVRKELRKR